MQGNKLNGNRLFEGLSFCFTSLSLQTVRISTDSRLAEPSSSDWREAWLPGVGVIAAESGEATTGSTTHSPYPGDEGPLVFLEELVAAHGGVVSSELTRTTSLLVAARGCTAKYLAALQHGIQIVKPQWIVDAVRGQQLPPSSDSLSSPYFVLPLFGFKFCSSGTLDDATDSTGTGRRTTFARWKTLISALGGQYDTTLTKDTTHLLLPPASLPPAGSVGAAAASYNVNKVKFARHHGIVCVNGLSFLEALVPHPPLARDDDSLLSLTVEEVRDTLGGAIDVVAAERHCAWTSPQGSGAQAPSGSSFSLQRTGPVGSTTSGLFSRVNSSAVLGQQLTPDEPTEKELQHPGDDSNHGTKRGTVLPVVTNGGDPKEAEERKEDAEEQKSSGWRLVELVEEMHSVVLLGCTGSEAAEVKSFAARWEILISPVFIHSQTTHIVVGSALTAAEAGWLMGLIAGELDFPKRCVVKPSFLIRFCQAALTQEGQEGKGSDARAEEDCECPDDGAALSLQVPIPRLGIDNIDLGKLATQQLQHQPQLQHHPSFSHGQEQEKSTTGIDKTATGTVGKGLSAAQFLRTHSSNSRAEVRPTEMEGEDGKERTSKKSSRHPTASTGTRKEGPRTLRSAAAFHHNQQTQTEGSNLKHQRGKTNSGNSGGKNVVMAPDSDARLRRALRSAYQSGGEVRRIAPVIDSQAENHYPPGKEGKERVESNAEGTLTLLQVFEKGTDLFLLSPEFKTASSEGVRRALTALSGTVITLATAQQYIDSGQGRTPADPGAAASSRSGNDGGGSTSASVFLRRTNNSRAVPASQKQAASDSSMLNVSHRGNVTLHLVLPQADQKAWGSSAKALQDIEIFSRLQGLISGGEGQTKALSHRLGPNASVSIAVRGVTTDWIASCSLIHKAVEEDKFVLFTEPCVPRKPNPTGTPAPSSYYFYQGKRYAKEKAVGVNVVFTSLQEERAVLAEGALEAVARALGGSVRDVFNTSAVTHVVTSYKSCPSQAQQGAMSEVLKAALFFAQDPNEHLEVVHVDWLWASYRAGYFVEEREYNLEAPQAPPEQEPPTDAPKDGDQAANSVPGLSDVDEAVMWQMLESTAEAADEYFPTPTPGGMEHKKETAEEDEGEPLGSAVGPNGTEQSGHQTTTTGACDCIIDVDVGEERQSTQRSSRKRSQSSVQVDRATTGTQNSTGARDDSPSSNRKRPRQTLSSPEQLLAVDTGDMNRGDDNFQTKNNPSRDTAPRVSGASVHRSQPTHKPLSQSKLLRVYVGSTPKLQWAVPVVARHPSTTVAPTVFTADIVVAPALHTFLEATLIAVASSKLLVTPSFLRALQSNLPSADSGSEGSPSSPSTGSRATVVCLSAKEILNTMVSVHLWSETVVSELAAPNRGGGGGDTEAHEPVAEEVDPIRSEADRRAALELVRGYHHWAKLHTKDRSIRPFIGVRAVLWGTKNYKSLHVILSAGGGTVVARSALSTVQRTAAELVAQEREHQETAFQGGRLLCCATADEVFEALRQSVTQHAPVTHIFVDRTVWQKEKELFQSMARTCQPSFLALIGGRGGGGGAAEPILIDGGGSDTTTGTGATTVTVEHSHWILRRLQSSGSSVEVQSGTAAKDKGEDTGIILQRCPPAAKKSAALYQFSIPTHGSSL